MKWSRECDKYGTAAELAISEVSGSQLFLGGATVTAARGESTCVDAAAVTATYQSGRKCHELS